MNLLWKPRNIEPGTWTSPTRDLGGREAAAPAADDHEIEVVPRIERGVQPVVELEGEEGRFDRPVLGEPALRCMGLGCRVFWFKFFGFLVDG